MDNEKKPMMTKGQFDSTYRIVSGQNEFAKLNQWEAMPSRDY